MLLAHMKQVAEAFLGEPVAKAVITVPAYFNEAQRQSTHDAGVIAGLDVLRILVEPTAAAIAYGLDRRHAAEQTKETVLVFDLGGGTFDVSLLRVDGGVFHVVATGGNTHLGGQDFDSRLVDYCLQEFKRQQMNRFSGVDLKGDMKAVQRLRQACEQSKRALSSATIAKITIDCLYCGKDFEFTLSRSRFEQLCQDLFDEAIGHVKQLLVDANMVTSDVDTVVVVGGSSRIPKIQQMLRVLFDGKEINKSLHAGEAVAFGATTLAAKLCGTEDDSWGDLVLMDATPLSLGVEVKGDLMSVVVPRHSTYPLTMTSSFHTCNDDQTSVRFRVFEGARPLTKDNNLLGKFHLRELEKRDRGEVSLRVTFSIDTNGLLTVRAVEEEKTVNANQIKIRNNMNRFSPQEIARMMAEAELFATIDANEKARIKALHALDDAVYAAEKKTKVTSTKVQRMRAWLEDHGDATQEMFMAKLREMKL
ncbi:Aste57867_11714 [Aphanomyces stellatus]|uniref:Aste57867_11714 protein n=1 Tax=Aphanomyces stellatus TaxID=120398 RepID=A0A485KVN1_9STRA|nr:hypothetical protein As57867_011671 [Aphanomyces stellatus]VFT88571.1 Aste57867_11714 [Aphanomyces stellatus]